MCKKFCFLLDFLRFVDSDKKKKAPAKFPDKNCERELLMTAVWQI